MTFNFLNVYCLLEIKELEIKESRIKIVLNNKNKQFQDGIWFCRENDNLSIIWHARQKGIKDEL